MNSVEFKDIFIKSILNGFKEAFTILWATDEFKSAVIGIPLAIFTYRIVGEIFALGRRYDIWFGRRGGKVLYYLINTFLVWLAMKFF